MFCRILLLFLMCLQNAVCGKNTCVSAISTWSRVSRFMILVDTSRAFSIFSWHLKFDLMASWWILPHTSHVFLRFHEFLKILIDKFCRHLSSIFQFFVHCALHLSSGVLSHPFRVFVAQIPVCAFVMFKHSFFNDVVAFWSFAWGPEFFKPKKFFIRIFHILLKELRGVYFPTREIIIQKKTQFW